MKQYILETERCRLREFNTNDASAIYKLNLHPDIFRFTTDPPFESESAAFSFLENYKTYTETGYGRWAVELKSSSTFIGWCRLKFLQKENEIDVGYRFLPEYWGQGFAVETARECCKWGFEVKGLTRIVARIHKENLRSIRVAEKLNMVYEKDLMYDGVWWLNYVITPEIFYSKNKV